MIFRFLLLGLSLWLPAASPARAQQLSLTSSTGIRLTAHAGGGVEIFAADGTQLMLFDGYRFTLGSTVVATGNATPSLVTADGLPAIQMSYAPTGGIAGTAVTGLFVPDGNALRLRFDIQAPSTPDNTMLRVRSIPGGAIKTTVHEGVWTRASNGGVPYEAPSLKGFRYTFSPARYALLHAPGYLPWNDNWSAHLSPRSVSAGHWRAEAAWILIENPAHRPHVGAAVLAGGPLSLDLWTTQPYNLWSNSSAPLPLHAQVFNAAPAARDITLSWWARDYAGAIVASDSDTQSIAAGAVWNRAIPFPAPARGLLFVEVSATAGVDTVFRRTNLGVLPPHAFAASDRLFGLANTFQLPDRATELALLRRLGVRSLRFQKFSSAEASAIDLEQTHHSNNTGWINGPVSNSWIDAELLKARDGGAPFWEVSNEMNFTSGSAADYVTNFLIPAKKRRDVVAPGVGLTLGGLAGWNASYLRALLAAGVWDHTDAFAFHPGRGNFTADYPGENGQVASPNTWNFLATIRNYKNALAAYPPKPLHITEAYASTPPNSGWHDTYRNAADAVLLSFALAKQEGIEVMHFYQLNDTVWNDVGGIDPTDAEYHFGLLNRDLSPKPSLLAYATVAENLEGAVFERWMSFDDPQKHGLLFSTPRGPVAVLWDRSDGYVLNYSPATAEPWVDRWTSRSSLTLPAALDRGPAAELYAQPFDNPGPGELNVSAKPGWTVYTASTGALTIAPKIQAGGVIYSSPAKSDALVFTDTGFGDIALPADGDLSLDMIASGNLGRVRLLVRLDNGRWYASNTAFTPVTASGWSTAFANNLEYRRLLRLDPAASEWSHFDFVPGAPMGPGAPLDAALPSRVITGLGWYVANTSPSFGLTARFDNLVVHDAGGAVARVLNALGQPGYVPAIVGQVTLTLDGSPRIVHGLAAHAGLDVIIDNTSQGASVTGSWTAASDLTDLYGANYVHDGDTGKGSKTFKFTPHLGLGGTYRVDLWWTAAANRASNVPVTVNHAGGATTTTINQQTGGGRWITLGAYAFSKGFGGNVTISNAGTNGRVVVDAARFVYQPYNYDAFAAWRSATFSAVESADPAISGPLAAPFGDAIPNLLRAALHLGRDSAASGLPVAEILDGQYLALRYRQLRGGSGTPGIDYTVGGLTYLVEVSNSLAADEWRSGASDIESVGAPVPLDPETELATVRVKTPLAGASRVFLRLRVTRAEP